MDRYNRTRRSINDGLIFINYINTLISNFSIINVKVHEDGSLLHFTAQTTEPIYSNIYSLIHQNNK